MGQASRNPYDACETLDKIRALATEDAQREIEELRAKIEVIG